LYNGQGMVQGWMRFKGNSSLQVEGLVGRDLKKLSFKLDFDEFEDQYSSKLDAISAFTVFKKLSLKNNYPNDKFHVYGKRLLRIF